MNVSILRERNTMMVSLTEACRSAYPAQWTAEWKVMCKRWRKKIYLNWDIEYTNEKIRDALCIHERCSI